MKSTLVRACAVACLFLFSAPVLKADDVVETAIKSKGFETLVAAVKAADLVAALQGDGPFTIFAPTDEAFAKLPAGTIQELLKPENKDRLVSILTYHVVPGSVTAKQALGLDSATTLEGQRLTLSSQLGRIQVNESNVTATDIRCDNGVIQVIDNVLLPTESTIPEVATKAGNFNTLLAAVGAAELAETLGGEGPFTVFAPTDEAFEKLPKGTVEELLKPENRQKLVSILTYHVVAGRVYSESVLETASAKTLQGQSVDFTLTAGGIQINESNFVAADIQAANGVIHVIDQVLIPTSLDADGARKLLENSVSAGARSFNHGDFHDCCETYTVSCNRIIEQGESLPEEVAAILKISLKRAKETKSEQERAWILRHGIDLAYYALNQ